MNATTFHDELPDEAPSLVACLSIVEDVRDLNRRHSLLSILVIAVCCMICGGETYNDMEDFGEANEDWFRTFLDLEHGIPSHDTFNRVFASLDPLRFRECFLRWTTGLRRAAGADVIALEGKSLRRAGNAKGVPHMVSAWSVRNAAENLAVLRHIVLNMLKGEKTKKRGIKGKQHNAAWNRSYLLKVLGTQVNPS